MPLSITVYLKVGGIDPLGAILMGKGAKKSMGAKMLSHYSITESISVSYYYDLLVLYKF